MARSSRRWFAVLLLLVAAPLAAQQAATAHTAEGLFNPHDFGAQGDGVTNDTAAFHHMSEAVERAGGGTIVIPPGTYIVGAQELAGVNGRGYSYRPTDGGRDVVQLSGTSKPVIIRGYGARLRLADGLRFGSFDPISGAPLGATLDHNFTARAGSLLHIEGATAPVSIEGVELDGNLDGLVVGGPNSPDGLQIFAAGLQLYGNSEVTVRDVYTHHNAADGVLLHYPGRKFSDPDTPVTLVNVRSEYNARCALAWSGGNGLTAIGCRFALTGRGRFATNPSAGIDIEAEANTASNEPTQLRNGQFINCDIFDNAAWGVISNSSGESSDVTFTNCVVWHFGREAVLLNFNKPRYVFRGCRFHGEVDLTSNVLPGAVTGDAPHFYDCHFDDSAHPERGVPTGDVLLRIDIADGHGALFEDCTFTANTRASMLVRGNEAKFCTFRRVTITHRWNPGKPGVQEAIVQNALLIDSRFSEELTGTIPPGLHILTQNTNVIEGAVIVEGPHVVWGVGGKAGAVGGM